MIRHLSIRVAWHDNNWNGAICNNPKANTYCLHLPRIYHTKDDNKEQAIAATHWSNLSQDQLPPCKAEGASFMSVLPYKREFKHPYANPNRTNIPHHVLKPTTFKVAPYTTFSVPFWWMLRGNQEEVKEIFPNVPTDSKPPFHSSWVYSPETQNTILKEFYKPIKEDKSLAIFYIKGANPLDDDSRRLIAGIGTVKKVGPILTYESDANYTYPLWDRMVTHGIRPGNRESEGVLLPYKEYLDLPEEFSLKTNEGKRSKYDLIDEIKLTLHDAASRKEVIDEFAYGSEWVNDSSLLLILGKLKSIILKIKEHGIAKGPWDEHILWVDKQIAQIKESMGPFPSFAEALIAYGFKYGYTLEDDLRSEHHLNEKDNPWDFWEDAIFGQLNLGKKVYTGDLKQFKEVWINESQTRKNLLEVLSRFELNSDQIKNWFNPAIRNKKWPGITDQMLLENPYILAEEDEGDKDHYPIAIETIDNGLFADKAIQGEFTAKSPQLVESTIDKRRIRAIIINVLKYAAQNGDTLLSVDEIIDRLNSLNSLRSSEIPLNYIPTNLDFLTEKLDHFKTADFECLQLKIFVTIEGYLRKVLIARSKRKLEPLGENWKELIKHVLVENGNKFNENNARHVAALTDQIAALAKVTGRKLSILHGPAGTGKTTVLGALFGSEVLSNEGILLLAPTGKARVKLGKMAGKEAFTIAQFLTRQKRFDWNTMKPKFHGPETYKGEQNVVIDECSMLTENDLYALLKALDLAHVKRIILVGDPYQLPPIGPGRPFADLCAYVETRQPGDDDDSAKESLARLNEVVRTVEGENSDVLTLASWYSGLKPSKNADNIFGKLGSNDLLNDMEVHSWGDEEGLLNKLNECLTKTLHLKNEQDFDALNKFLGIDGDIVDTNKIEAFQLLSPVKGPFWGSFNINRKFQQQFRYGIKDKVKIGDYEIRNYDKVIQTVNEKKELFPGNKEYQLSNGQLGLVKNINKGHANVVFAGIEANGTFGYKTQGEMGEDSANLELAYAITVHKSQGSDFEYVFLILPKTGRILSRELVYTALTRAKQKLILLVEGDSPHWILNLSKPQYSETAKRNTHLFQPSVRRAAAIIPYADGLIHKTKKEGLIVRSKSEVIIANMLIEKEVPFEYEREYIGDNGERRIPDFTFIDAAGDIIILEHLGMLSIPSYKADWDKKLAFYEENGFTLEENLFITTESDVNGIDSLAIEKTLDRISALI